MTQTLENRIKSERERAGLTQAGLAELVGVSRKTVNTVENGVFTPSTILALKLAKALNTTVEQLFRIKG
ncbi:MAG TPA: helix-turn-helix transcriptional regulator [Sphingomicrobium sp.]|nr:helix-turn-helix transcriptional regulator [Sphingomicrobium sp.]